MLVGEHEVDRHPSRWVVVAALGRHLNPNSLEIVIAKLEPSLADAEPGERFQFERLGYFHADPIDSVVEAPVFNRTVTLRDAWGKEAKK